jgi:hypothetical protein
LIKSKGYKIMGYSNDNGTTITPYTIDQIDKEGGYN